MGHGPNRLTERTYLGEVKYKGVWYPNGDHPQTISRELFDKVQEVRATHNRSGDKRRKHHHYLKGTLFCGHCGSRLGMTPSTGNGGTYDYLYCIGRHRGDNCLQPYVVIDKIEPQVTALYRSIPIVPAWRERVREALREDAAHHLSRRQQAVTEQQQRLDRLKRERDNLARAVRQAPRLAEDINRQLDEIEVQERAAKKLLNDATIDRNKLAKVFADAEKLVDRLHLACRIESDQGRRLLNQFFFEKVLIQDDRISSVVYTETARLILGYPPERPEPTIEGSNGPATVVVEETNHDTLSGGRGSNMYRLVELRGLEPLTP